MNDSLEVESSINVGSKFNVKIPLEFVSTKPIASKVMEEKSVNNFSEKIHVLVAEDNLIDQKVIKYQLDKLGIKSSIAGNGIEVLELLRSQTFDLILMDCQMPSMDGFEATIKIREQASMFQNIPIIALTANALTGDCERCLSVGMNDYLSKPVEIVELSKRIGFLIAANKKDASA